MFWVSYVALTVRARIRGFDWTLEEAAMDLGATPFRVFYKVTLPIIAPGIVAASMLAFALSLDDFIITLFNAGSRITYPLYVYGARRAAFPAQINVLATAILLASLILLGATVLWQHRVERARSGGPAASLSRPPREQSMKPIEQACYWLARRPPRDAVVLGGRRDADIVVIGAGLTGLWSALFLKSLDPAAEVAVVEQGVAAYGASGRNAGMLSETVDHSHGSPFSISARRRRAGWRSVGERNVAEMLGFLPSAGSTATTSRPAV